MDEEIVLFYAGRGAYEKAIFRKLSNIWNSPAKWTNIIKPMKFYIYAGKNWANSKKHSPVWSILLH